MFNNFSDFKDNNCDDKKKDFIILLWIFFRFIWLIFIYNIHF
jgi:hypothetical protein